MWKKILFIIISIGFVCGAAQAKVKSVEEQRAEWNKWLEQLKEEMADKGISKKTINEAYKEDYFHEIKEVELQDKSRQNLSLLPTNTSTGWLIREKSAKRANSIKN